MRSGELLEQTLSKAEIIARFIALEQDPRFRDFSGKIEVNEYGDLLMNAASRLHVVVQKRLAGIVNLAMKVSESHHETYHIDSANLYE